MPTDDFGSLVPWILVVLGAIVAWLLIRRRQSRPRTLASVLNKISFDRLEGIVIPKADEGEIQIDHIILTAQGLLIIEPKDVEGAVFGSDKMEHWTVISNDKRFTFNNPQPALYDRIAAVRRIVRQVPVAGRVVFLDGASFTKGVPSLVCNLDELQDQFGDSDTDAAKVKVEAFIPHWEHIKARANQ